MEKREKICVLGATGYVGSRLVANLLDQGWHVNVLVRSKEKAQAMPWYAHPRLTVVVGNVLATGDFTQDEAGQGEQVFTGPEQKSTGLRRVISGCSVVYYLIHSLNPHVKDFAKADKKAARNTVQACDLAQVQRIIYLSGVEPEDEELSHHLASRAEVASILETAKAKVTVLRAAQILGAGSASFELVRYLVDRLPIMITPRWVESLCQPIAISNVLGYLMGCLDHEETAGQGFDICGPDTLSYRELFHLYAQEAGLARRLILKVPVLTPELSARWLGLITPVPTALARPLVHGLRNNATCHESRIRAIIPQELVSCREAIRRALDRIAHHEVATCRRYIGVIERPLQTEMAQNTSENPTESPNGRPDHSDHSKTQTYPEWPQAHEVHTGQGFAGGTLLQCAYAIDIDATPHAIWPTIERIGGHQGWYDYNALWRLRGALDVMVGGVGMRRGRRDPEHLHVGDAVDFWRVVDMRENARLLLLAEMKVPGEALLEFRLLPINEQKTELQMIAWFLPRGLTGLAYWWSLYPIHQALFSGMLHSIALHSGHRVLRKPWKIMAKMEHCSG